MYRSTILTLGLPLAFACRTGSTETDSTAGGTAEPCPGMDCPDELTLQIRSPDGSPSDAFGGWAELQDGTRSSFACGDTVEAFDGGRCLGDGSVALNLHGSTVMVWVDEGDDGPWFSGELTPTWDAPWDSEACGHYCYIAEETITLEPCDGCG